MITTIQGMPKTKNKPVKKNEREVADRRGRDAGGRKFLFYIIMDFVAAKGG